MTVSLILKRKGGDIVTVRPDTGPHGEQND